MKYVLMSSAFLATLADQVERLADTVSDTDRAERALRIRNLLYYHRETAPHGSVDAPHARCWHCGAFGGTHFRHCEADRVVLTQAGREALE